MSHVAQAPPTTEWNRLSPHRPLSPSEGDLYVDRPWSGGQRLADLLIAGLGPIAVTGSVGSGKSTELAAAARTMQGNAVTVLAQLDRTLDMGGFDHDRLFLQLAGRVADVASRVLHLRLSDPIVRRLSRAGQIPTQATTTARDFSGTNHDLLLATVREVVRSCRQGRLALLVDGLEKSSPGAAGAAITATLSLRDDATLAFVVPPALVTGPEAAQLLEVVRVFPIRAVPVLPGPNYDVQRACEFLESIARLRLGGAETSELLSTVIRAAAIASGGLPRTFLALLRDAASYSQISRHEAPDRSDLDAAIQDHADGLRRLLREGDLAAMRQMRGTSGTEISLERRIRLLTHGLLLEYETRDGRAVVWPHVLLEPDQLAARLKAP